MGYSPKFSSEKLAEKLGLDLKSIDMFEINEAFASQAYAVSRDLGLDPEKVNIYGGGISIGHPIGATGVILAVKVLYELQRTGKKDAMVSMCIGGGQGISMYLPKTDIGIKTGLKSVMEDFGPGFRYAYALMYFSIHILLYPIFKSPEYLRDNTTAETAAHLVQSRKEPPCIHKNRQNTRLPMTRMV